MTWITETLSDFHDDIKLSRIKRVKEERWGSVNLELHGKFISDNIIWIENWLYSAENGIDVSNVVDGIYLTKKNVKKLKKIIKTAKNQGWFTNTTDS